MTTLNNYNYVDDSDDVMAAHVNDLVASSLRSEYKNVETLSATRTLLDVDTPLQRFDCNGENRIVKMPTADAVENHLSLIVNSTASGTYTLTVQNNEGTITHAVLNPSEFILMLPDGNGTYLPFGKPFNGILTPSQITSNQDNYNPTGAGAADVIRISSDAARSITGLAFPAQNKTIILANVGTYTITLVNDATSTAANRFLLGADFDLEADKSVILIYDATSSRWRMVGGSAAPIATNTIIEGMQLIWNSATSLSVGTGFCYAENGDEIDITSALTASSLSLSNSTWYHVYVYLSGGSPAMEVVTTDPAAWKGMAHSKTGDTSRRYIGSVVTDGSGNVRRFMHDVQTNLIQYLNANIGASPFRVLSNGTATSATPVDFSPVVPVTSNLAFARVANTSASSSLETGVATLTTSTYDQTFGVSVRAAVTMPLVSQETYYAYGSAPTNGAYIDVNAYYFKR